MVTFDNIRDQHDGVLSFFIGFVNVFLCEMGAITVILRAERNSEAQAS